MSSATLPNRNEPGSPPASPGFTSRASAVDLIVLSTDSALLAAMQAAAEGEALFWPATTAESAVEHLISGRCGILLVDLVRLPGDVSALLARLIAQFPGLVLMVAGRREDEGAVGQLLISGAIYRYIHKPVSPGRAQQFLNAAVRRYRELNEREPVGLATVREFGRVTLWRKLYRHSLRGLGVVSALVLVGLIGSTVKHALQPEPELPLQVPSDASSLSSQPSITLSAPVRSAPPMAERAAISVAPLDERFRDIQLMIQGGRLNAATRALRELGAHAADDARVAILATSIGELLLTRSSVAIGTGDLDLAQRRLNAAIAVDREFNLDLPDLASARSALDQARALALHSEVSALLDLARSQREAGNLIAPEGSSAYDQVQFARARAAEAEEVRAETQALAIALLEAAEAAIAEQRFRTARELLDHADALVPAMSAARRLRAELDLLDQSTPASNAQ